jgi:hypothetical protein
LNCVPTVAELCDGRPVAAPQAETSAS